MRALFLFLLILPFSLTAQIRITPFGNQPDPLRPRINRGSDAGNPSAVAMFDPATGRAGRPVDYTVMITSNQRVSELPSPLPAPEGLVVQGDMKNFSMQITQNAAVQVSAHRFTIIPTRAGEFTMPAFEIEADGVKIQVPATVLVVEEADPNQAPYQPVRAVIDVEDRTLFVGETIAARMLIFDTADEIPQSIMHMAKTSGSVIFRHQLRASRESFTWQGKEYTGIVMPIQLTPLASGESELNAQMLGQVQKRDMAGRGLAIYQANIQTQSVRIKVEPLPPAGRTKSFTGGVGDFTISQPVLSTPEVMVGEPVTLTVTLKGTGNIEGISFPEMEKNDDWDSYPPTSELFKNEIELSGAKAFTYTFIPKHENAKGTPSLPFSFFDPKKRAYVDATVPPVPIKVNANPALAKAAAEDAADNPAASETVLLPPDPPKPALTGLEEKSGRWVSSLALPFEQSWFLMLQAVPPLTLLVLWAWQRRRRYLAANPQVLRRRLARRAARQHLDKARAAVRRGDQTQFLNEGVRALREAVAPLDSTLPDSLVAEEVIRHFQDDADAKEAVTRIYEAANSAYAPVGMGTLQPVSLLSSLESVIAKLNSKL